MLGCSNQNYENFDFIRLRLTIYFERPNDVLHVFSQQMNWAEIMSAYIKMC